MHRSLVASIFCILLNTAMLSPQRAAQGQSGVINGVHLWYRIAGVSTPGRVPLLYLHGGPGYNSYSFEKMVGPRLEKQMQVVYFDQRGSGRSERPASRDYSMAALVEDVESLRRQLGVPQLSLLGHSFGATIALEYAARYPEHVRKLIVLDGAVDMPRTWVDWEREIEARYPEPWRAVMSGEPGEALRAAEQGGSSCSIAKARFALDMAALSRVDRQQFADWQQFHDQRFRREQKAWDDRSGLRNTGELSNAYFAPGRDYLCYRFAEFGRLTMPVLVMGGRFDGAIAIDRMRMLARALPDARFDEFTRSAHFPYAEESNKFVRDVSHFLTFGVETHRQAAGVH